MKKEVLKTTASLCPVCVRRIPADYVRRGEDVLLEKYCPEHGDFSAVVWRGPPDFMAWQQGWRVDAAENPECPGRCGLCGKHITPTCCAVLEVTERCNLSCNYCLAAAGQGEHMPLEKVYAALDDMYEKGVRSVHFGGGEPSLRDDLDKITAYAVRRGYQYIQLNSNGLRLADEPGYAERLRDAGLSSVFLQFDGTTDDIYQAIRGRALLDVKCRAIRRCDEAELAVILVPAIVPGINDGDLGNIVRFAAASMPAVKGIHCQPVTYMGRSVSQDRPRITIPEVLRLIEEQTEGMIRAEQLAPSVGDAPLCGFHGEFRMCDGVLKPLFSSDKNVCCGQGSAVPDRSTNLADAVRRSQNHVKNRWTRMRRKDTPPGSIDRFLQELNDRNFSLSGMAFQDENTMDLARVMQCTLHVYKEGKLMPFCLYHSFFQQDRV